MALSSEPLSPDVANTAPLTRREIADLLPEVPGWSLEDGHLTARFICKGFCDAVAFFQEIARFSARENHFPDIGIHKGRIVDVAWYTYAIGGLSRNDFIMAARLSEWLWCRQGGAL
ncbi:MAG TPA: 4a-hydroxytetrahydrobiopterin dehydratase [Candidatus Methanoculleus thermohydrogenotrophicum]|jgi:4a-hydroxytetrahydrobiopterin dehydratase|nr:4a-hydroxytetrahydrobiopterin dehydratase [Candidatus Methanoculleus thermohydrogenotrophicum]NLM82126.1 4a-hydroxytetrahydrobiopterin dehydratase [Candidatus Methanoculleus thermohydrogenotrophicum]HOB17181.1 4a-hydroxytetrahydrobiopterin dehydratase [Candidatus Methanoculleus thermohydrogenotrophicum]HPZ37260.1 4a-hydroxytetrahydrobiopterin dehydratase [Candidatus Methanoculleus thermohydrogenotrophicum]HQC90526.1 4a-hydroxytetrahydrobiopterin dehydratase [Candidatus Methanoculleus thermoh